MKKIVLPIDTKSLYYNIYNDNLSGHTCTVATPIKQGKSERQEFRDIYKIPKQVDFERSQKLINELVKNSKSIVRINNVFVFDKIKVNGRILEAEKSFCFYIKEEVDPKRAQFGRIKLHYPISLKLDEMNIDNRYIINLISDKFFGYAFIVESFEYNFDDDYLNFNILIVGYNNIPYSKVFINNKGTGEKFNKLIKNYADNYDTEIVPIKRIYGNDISSEKYFKIIEKSELDAKDIIKEYLQKKNFTNIRVVSNLYPYSLFDIQYENNGDVFYGVIFFTFTKLTYFTLTNYQNQFINLFNNVQIFLISDFEGQNNILEINKSEIETYSALISSIRFVK